MIVGIDTGLSGAVAFFNPPHDLMVRDMPTLLLQRGGKNKREVDADVLADLLGQHEISRAFVERVNAMPARGHKLAGSDELVRGQGITSAFAQGVSFGVVCGVLAALQIPREFVVPQRWKKALHVPTGKDAARARASQLMPQAAHQWRRVKDDGRAEAACIAFYGLTVLCPPEHGVV